MYLLQKSEVGELAQVGILIPGAGCSHRSTHFVLFLFQLSFYERRLLAFPSPGVKIAKTLKGYIPSPLLRSHFIDQNDKQMLAGHLRAARELVSVKTLRLKFLRYRQVFPVTSYRTSSHAVPKAYSARLNY